jgi:hypothetical protein
MDSVQIGHHYLIPMGGTRQWVRVFGPSQDKGFWLCELNATGDLIDVPERVFEMNNDRANIPAGVAGNAGQT